jgi:hypothetical protein
MASPQLTLNPAQQTNFAGTFALSSAGFVQGDALDDPHTRFFLRKGIVSSSVTQPLWGGVAISAALSPGGIGVGATNPSENFGNILLPATTLTAAASGYLNGWAVTNQAQAMFTTPQSRAPQAPSGGAINYYPSGSRARIPLAVLAAAATEWASAATVGPADIYWDTVNLRLTNAPGSGIIGPLPNVSIDSINLSNSRTINVNETSAGYTTTGNVNWLEGQPCVVLVV